MTSRDTARWMEETVTLIGYHASHEQFPPSELLECVQLAEQAGFDVLPLLRDGR